MYQAIFLDAKSMAIFTGEHECRMDTKGRLLFPAKLRAKLPECSRNEIVLSQGMEPCLVVYSKEEYQKVFEKVSALNRFNTEHRMLMRNFFRGSLEIELDNMGRFLIPKRMAQHAKLEKDTLIVGTGDVLEIWSPEEYEKYLLKDPEEYAILAQKFLDD